MNSRVALAEAAKLISKLIDRTQEGKIAWSASPKRNSLSALETPLDGNLKATVWMTNGQAGFRLSKSQVEAAGDLEFEDQTELIEGRESALLSISLGEEFRRHYDFPEEADIYIQLVELHELARRSAYKMDAQFENIYDYLDRLAG
jgi:hypothetical protein